MSRQWSGKTLAEHKADRATVVREALEAASLVAPEIERMAATLLAPDGKPRYLWSEERPDLITYARIIMAAVAERLGWQSRYQTAKDHLAAVNHGAVDNCSATVGPLPTMTTDRPQPRRAGNAHTSASTG